MTTESIGLRWGGGVSPFGISWQKMFMWWFIVTDALLFASFLASYGFNRLASASWPDQSEVFHMDFIAAMTFVLITSSATMATAVAASRRGDSRIALRFLLLTIVGGVCFLGMQAYEWSMIIGEGARIDYSPWSPGEPGFVSFFFLITGFHGTHVLIGAIVLACVAIKARRGKATADGYELSGLYWHFVDLVWVFVFGCFYLI